MGVRLAVTDLPESNWALKFRVELTSQKLVFGDGKPSCDGNLTESLLAGSTLLSGHLHLKI